MCLTIPALFFSGKNEWAFTRPTFRFSNSALCGCVPPRYPTHLLENPQQYITRVGRILRKTSLDELPQIFQIFTGKMAVIGPRPALWNQYDLIAQRDLYGANDVRPGLTGWAQINGRDELPIDVKARLDGEYVKKMSFLFDCKCFFGSITAVLKHEGVVEKPYFQDGMEAVWENVKDDAEKTAKKRRVALSQNRIAH